MNRTPFILFGDGPRLTSGLARIARDLALRVVAESEELGVRFAQVGVDEPGGWHWQPWDFYGFQPTERDQGRGAVSTVVTELKAETGREPVVFGIVDPARFFDITRTAGDGEIEIDTERCWLYAPIDATTPTDRLGGPAGAAVCQCERVLGYGRWGAGVLKRTRENWPQFTPVEATGPVSYLPHGIDTRIFQPDVPYSETDPGFRKWVGNLPPDTLVIGAVATNQPRKDLGILFAAVAEIIKQGHPAALWLHTDVPTRYWDIGELAYQMGLRPEQVFASWQELSDVQLAARYSVSDVTIAPGLGEGFGYPIVESLACGTPVVHVDYAGGAELVPEASWRVQPVAWRLESIYTLQRPVLKPADVAEAALRAVTWAAGMPGATAAAYCAGSVAHLDWQHLWPRWKAWLRQGLKADIHWGNFRGTGRAPQPVQ